MSGSSRAVANSRTTHFASRMHVRGSGGLGAGRSWLTAADVPAGGGSGLRHRAVRSGHGRRRAAGGADRAAPAGPRVAPGGNQYPWGIDRMLLRGSDRPGDRGSPAGSAGARSAHLRADRAAFGGTLGDPGVCGCATGERRSSGAARSVTQCHPASDPTTRWPSTIPSRTPDCPAGPDSSPSGSAGTACRDLSPLAVDERHEQVPHPC